jgi:hypothetical protein
MDLVGVRFPPNTPRHVQQNLLLAVKGTYATHCDPDPVHATFNSTYTQATLKGGPYHSSYVVPLYTVPTPSRQPPPPPASPWADNSWCA